MPAPTPVALADGVWRIPTFGANLINSFAFGEPDGGITLVDAGLKGAPPRLVAALAAIGRGPHDVRRILLTHAHPDHIGGAARLRTTTGATAHIHDDDAGFARAGRRPPPDPARPLAKVFAMLSGSQTATEIDATFSDGDLLPFGGGIRVLHTPGHSPGHCSFLHEGSGVLVTGDAVFNFRHKLSYSFAAFCSNFAQSKDTAERLGEADYEVAAFTHGPELRDGAREALRAFLRRRA